MKHFLLILLISCSTLLAAQSDTTTLYAKNPVFVQVGVGLFPNTGLFNAELSVALGYRFNQRFGIGFEYRLTSTHNESFGDEAKLFGLQLRRQYRSGMVASLGGGMVLEAFRGNDGFDAYEYRSGGYYLAADVAYQFRWGATVGVYATAALEHRHESLRYSDDTDIYEPTGSVTPYSFAGFGFKLGYAFPMRGRRR